MLKWFATSYWVVLELGRKVAFFTYAKQYKYTFILSFLENFLAKECQKKILKNRLYKCYR